MSAAATAATTPAIGPFSAKNDEFTPFTTARHWASMGSIPGAHSTT